ncbi:MAG TPA: cytochrome c oxidase subunit II, partial [Chroococcales cyanobacterium]
MADSGCAMDINQAEISNIFNFATEQARTIVHLHWLVLGVCILIGATVMGLLGYASVKFRQRDSDAEPEQSPGDIKLEILWTVGPFLIVSFLGVMTAIVMHQINPSVGARQPDVIVIAHQWWWEYRYPKYGVVTANELYLPQGADYLLEIRAADVVHSFWVPDFGEKMDAIPGHPNHLFFKPLRAGVFIGSCSEYCGADHALMRIIVRVVPADAFSDWIKSQKEVPIAAGTPAAANGEKLFMSNTCSRCHEIAGTDAKAQVGPNLSHLADRKTIGTGIIPNDQANLAKWIINPQQFKPGCYMPKMRLTEKDATDIAAYLDGL